jgi:NADH:ubiquinone oxidoreductase subunit K
MLPLNYYLIVSALLFCIGMFGVLSRRNVISILMGIELMLNSVNLTFVAFSRYMVKTPHHGQIFAIFVITVAAAEAAVALAIVLGLYRNWRTVQVDEINLMKW